ncbi:MAG: insulinase family protein [Oscillospiraceae bacterium]|nr:insulinase family protein [Oscillospiraceae bacterium]
MKIYDYERLGEKLIHHASPNGLNIYIVPKKDYAKSFAMLAANYGGSDTRFKKDGKWLDTPAGIAHFLEHKLFDMPDGVSAEERFARTGAATNAFTSSDMTVYYFEATDKFQENLKILLEFVSTPYFTEKSVAKEQGIIGQEIGMIEDDPGWKGYKNLLECLYKEHPLRVSVAGTVESIAEITHETLYDCHRTFYTPSNMVMCVAGDVDADEIIRIAEEIMPAENLPQTERCYGENEPEGSVSPLAQVVMEVSMPKFTMGFKLPAPKDGREHQQLEIMGELACQALFGTSSPLYSRLYTAGLINSSFGGETELYKGAAAVIIGGESRDYNAVYDAIVEEAARIGREGLDRDLFRRLKKAALGDRIKELGSFEGVCIRLAEAHFAGSDYFSFMDTFDTVTCEKVEQFIAKYFVKDRGAMSLVLGRQDAK